MFGEALVTLDWVGYGAFYGAIAIIIFAVFWYLQREERLARERFFEKFEVSQLRMSPYKVGLVFRVLETDESKVSVIPIWDGKSSIADGKVQRLTTDQLVPFDETRFF